MRGWWARVLRLIRWKAAERDIQDELRFHIDMETEYLVREGLDGTEARRRARLTFGGEDRWREKVRAARGTAWIEDSVRDLRLAARSLARTPGFTVAAVGTIALGVGAATAVHSVVGQVVMSPLPFDRADDLVTVWVTDNERGIRDGTTSWPNFEDWRREAVALDAMATVVPTRATLIGSGDPVDLTGVSVSSGFFELIGEPVALGRGFRDEESELESASVVVLSHDVFTSRFGADPRLLGRLIRLDGASYEVVGVAARGRSYPRSAQFWVPQSFGPNRDGMFPRHRFHFPAIGRLSEGTGLPRAQEEMDLIASRLEARYPGVNGGVGVRLEPLQRTIVGDVREPLLVMLAAVGALMAIAVLNVGSLFLARGAAQTREIAVRLALGAGRGRVARQMLARSAVIGGLGGLLGAGLAGVGVIALVAMAPAELPRLEEVHLDPVALVSALAVAAVASLVFGTLPVLQATRVDPEQAFRSGGRGSSASGIRRAHAGFVSGQFALALLLLISSSLLMRSFARVNGVDPGFDPAGVGGFSVTLPADRYPDAPARAAFHQDLHAALQEQPGIEGVGAATRLFVADGPTTGFATVEHRADRPTSSTEVAVLGDYVSAGFHAVLGVPLVAGRGFDRRDGPDGVRTAVVNEAFVRQHFGDRDPLGARFAWGRPYGPATQWFTIVGVVADTRRAGLDRPAWPTVFQPFTQRPPAAAEYFVRSSLDAARLEEAVRAAVAGLDPDLPVANDGPLVRAMAESLATRRFIAMILTAFSLTSLALAAIGVFGVTSYLVSRRTREIGIRIALGAARGRVLRDVLRAVGLQVGAGLALGLLAWLWLSGLIERQLFEVEVTDPTTLVASISVLALTALSACLVPARHAASVDAMVALREE